MSHSAMSGFQIAAELELGDPGGEKWQTLCQLSSRSESGILSQLTC